MERFLEVLFGLIALSILLTILCVRLAILVAILLSILYAVLAVVHEIDKRKKNKNNMFNKRR